MMLRRIIEDRNPLLTSLCSKDATKSRVRKLVAPSELRISNTIWKGSATEIPEGILRAQLSATEWVLKPNNLGGGLILFPADYHDADLREAVQKFITRAEKVDDIYRRSAPLAWRGSESGYIIEERIGGTRVEDFKVHVFNGTPRILSVYTNRDTSLSVQHFDVSGSLLFERNPTPNSAKPSKKLQDALFRLASRLSLSLEYIRVDFYWSNEEVWLGEISPFGALDGLNRNRRLDRTMGEWWTAGRSDDFEGLV